LKEHGKLYATPSEYNYRLNVFYDQTLYIDQSNRDYEAAAAASGQVLTGPMFEMNSFGDLSAEEFKAKYAGGAPLPENEVLESESPVPIEDSQQLAASNLGQSFTVNIKNQGSCGSCWAFAAVAALEKYHFDKTRARVDFSQQELVDCETGSNGCNGGYSEKAFNYASTNGLSLASKYPYKGTRGSCGRVASNSVKIGNAGSGYNGFSQSKMVQLTQKGVHSALYVYCSGKFRYVSKTNDVLDARSTGECGTGIDHVINLSSASGDTITVYNSWGTGWGVNGFKTIRVCSETSLWGSGCRYTHPYGAI
jgi:cathepsin L